MIVEVASWMAYEELPIAGVCAGRSAWAEGDPDVAVDFVMVGSIRLIPRSRILRNTKNSRWISAGAALVGLRGGVCVHQRALDNGVPFLDGKYTWPRLPGRN